MSTRITDLVSWLSSSAIDGDRVEGPSCQVASLTQPFELCFRCIQLQTIVRDPLVSDLDAVSVPFGESRDSTGETVDEIHEIPDVLG